MKPETVKQDPNFSKALQTNVNFYTHNEQACRKKIEIGYRYRYTILMWKNSIASLHALSFSMNILCV